MSKDLNQCNFIGRLGKDVTTRYTQSGKAVCSFSIACGDDRKDKDGNKVEQTNWVPVVVFGKLAEICDKYLSKGSQVFISGKFTVRKWTDNNGQDRYTTEIVANEMQMLGGGQQQSQPQSQTQENQKPSYDDGFSDSIPF